MTIRLTESQLRRVIRDTIRETYSKNNNNKMNESLRFFATGGGMGWGGGRRQPNWSSSGSEVKNVDRPKPTMLVSSNPDISEELALLNALALKATYQPEAATGVFSHVRLEEYNVQFVILGRYGHNSSQNASDEIAFLNNDFGDLNVSSISNFSFNETYPGNYRGTGSATVNLVGHPEITRVIISWTTK